MKMTNDLIYQCHQAIDTMAKLIAKIPEAEDGGLEVEIAENFGKAISTMNYICMVHSTLKSEQTTSN